MAAWGWGDGSTVKNAAVLIEDSGSIPRTHTEVHNYL